MDITRAAPRRGGGPGRRRSAAILAFAAGGALAGCTIDNNFTPLNPVASVAPDGLDFEPTVAGEETSTLELYVSNSGPVTLAVDDILVDGAVFSVLGPTAFEVVRDETAVVEVQFAPTEVAPYEGALTLLTNDPEAEEIPVPLTGTGRVPYAPDIDVPLPNLAVVWNVPSGSREIEIVEIANVGDAPLRIDGIAQTGSGAFSVQRDPTGEIVQPNQSTSLLVQYEPVPGRSEGDSGTIVIASDDPDEPEVTVNLEGNGGGGADDYPVAVIDCPGTIGIAGPEVVSFDGSASYDPLGGALTYDWQVVLRPTGVDANNAIEVDPTDPALASLLLDGAGEWEVQLTVTTVADPPLSSVPAKCRIDAEPEDRIHVELSWPGGPTSDLDLHLARDLGEFYVTPDDVSWCNANPDWGVAGNPDDDPRLDADASSGGGPENINVFEPADGEYQVRVHLFDDGDDGDTTAEVRVYLDGELAWSGARLLSRNQVWDVGRILWPEAVFSADTTEPWDAEGVRECR